MADIQDLQYVFLHFDVIKVLHANLDHLQTLIQISPEFTSILLETQKHILLAIEQLEEPL